MQHTRTYVAKKRIKIIKWKIKEQNAGIPNWESPRAATYIVVARMMALYYLHKSKYDLV